MKEKFTKLQEIEKEITLDKLLEKLLPLIEKDKIPDELFIINISGASAAGKSTISDIISTKIPNCEVLNMDNYLRGWGIGLLNHDSGDPYKPYFARLNPAVYDLEKLHEDVIQLKNGKSIERPVFDELEKEPSGTWIFKPSKILVLEGIYSLESPFLELGNVSILIEAPLHDRLFRKIVRNSTLYRENINNIICTYLTKDEPTYPYYRKDLRTKAQLIVNNPLNPLRDFSSFPKQESISYTNSIKKLTPKTEYGKLHPEETLEIIELDNGDKLLSYIIGNKLLINDIVDHNTYELIKIYYKLN